nr:low-density lipoprotein receptor-related protein 12 [Parasteatoda tepidariorum]
MKTGFSLDFNHNCNRILTELNGSINTPNYPWYRGVTTAECIYEIRLRPGYLVNITFHDVEIGYGDNDDCNIDYIQIRDGDTEKSPLIADICGSMESYSVKSTSNHLWMKLKAGYFLNDGFYANYSAVAIAHDDCYPRDSFRCANNTCIPKSEVCDGIKNCENGADELGCVYNDCKSNDSFRCSENTCIARSEVCDGMINCPNGADEIGCHQIVGMSTNIDGPKEEVTTDSSKQTIQTSSTVDKLESTTMAQKLPPCANGTKHSTIKDVMDIAVEEHRRRLEVIELQKRYEMDRIEFQKIFEIEKLKQMKQYHNFKIRGAKNKLSKDSSEE